MNHIHLIICLLVISYSAQSQNQWGFEIRTSHIVTHNGSKLNSGSTGLSAYTITKEENTNTTSFSFGALHRLNTRTTLRLHIGKHQSGRMLDLTTRDDVGTTQVYENFKNTYNLVQLTPSVSYNIINQKIKVPLEVGVSINRRMTTRGGAFVYIKNYNFDFRASSGVQFTTDKFHFGINAVYSRAISEYQTKAVQGKYLPYQHGLELVIGYTLKQNQDNL